MRFDPLSPEVLSNPYPHYQWLQQHDPVHWGAAGDTTLPGRWYVTRLDDVAGVLKEMRFGREVDKVQVDAARTIPESQQKIAELAQGWMILRDPPVHTRLRALVHRHYAPREVAKYREVASEFAEHLIGQMLAVGPPIDLLSHFALPLTVGITARMLGLPIEDIGALAEWSRSLATVIDLNQSEDVRERSSRAVTELLDYLQVHIGERRRRPQDDLLSSLVQMDDLSEFERLGTLTHLLFVGNDPVMHMIGNGLYHLLCNPDQKVLLERQPALIERAVDELMRFDSPVQMTFRYALTGIELHGKEIRTGDHVAVVLGAANRDPQYHSRPDHLDIMRQSTNLMHFGSGIHYCLGAPVAKIEGQVGILALLQQLPNLSLATREHTWQPTAAVRGLVELPVNF
jgi:pimeloyl-[acyl-carrier protein] synthase